MESITPTDLIFAPDDGQNWHFLDGEQLHHGMVCYQTMDRCDDWDIFVVISHDKTANEIRAIFPRMRVIDSRVVLGQDKTTFRCDIKDDCTCPEVVQGGCWFCNCGNLERIVAEYGETFEEASAPAYNIVSFKLRRIILCHAYLKDVNHLDIPLEDQYPPWVDKTEKTD
jgi:hypothetical protein